MSGQMPNVYEGDHPYVFACYAHADRDAVLPIIRALVDKGYRVWWDDGIEAATPYPEHIADHVFRCTSFIMFVSRWSLKSNWCINEVNYALDLGRIVLPIYLEEVELKRGLQMRMGHNQAMFWNKYSSDEAFCEELFKAVLLDPCLTSKGKKRRGVKPKPGPPHTDMRVFPEPTPNNQYFRIAIVAIMIMITIVVVATLVSASTATVNEGTAEDGTETVDKAGAKAKSSDDGELATVTRDDGHSDADDVAVKSGIDAYSWEELKSLSQKISDAEENEWLDIAKGYNLVDENGKLQGDTKAFTLNDEKATEAKVRIAGFRHDVLTDGNVAGITFEFANVPLTHQMNDTKKNEGGWELSSMRDWLNNDFLKLLPEDLRDSIAMALKETNNIGATEGTDGTPFVTRTPDKLWLLSSNEIYGELSGVYGAEGTQYRIYVDKGVTAENYGSCAKDGENAIWWLRSPRADVPGWFNCANFDGDLYTATANDSWGVSPGFCF